MRIGAHYSDERGDGSLRLADIMQSEGILHVVWSSA